MPLIEFTFDDLLKNIQRQAQTKADNVPEAAFTQRKVLQELAELGTKQLPNLLKQLKEVDAEQFHDREVTGSPLVEGDGNFAHLKTDRESLDTML